MASRSGASLASKLRGLYTSQKTRDQLEYAEASAKGVVTRIARKENPNITYDYDSAEVQKGVKFHPSSTAPDDPRPSVSVLLKGTPKGDNLIHVFPDHTVQERKTMLKYRKEMNQFKSDLFAAESKFPELGHTKERMEAEAKRDGIINALRDGNEPDMRKWMQEKFEADQELADVIERQESERQDAEESSKS